MTETIRRPPPPVSQIMAYEQGEMSDDEMVEFFQQLIDSGLAWSLQESYGRMAMRLIEAGYCTDSRTRVDPEWGRSKEDRE